MLIGFLLDQVKINAFYVNFMAGVVKLLPDGSLFIHSVRKVAKEKGGRTKRLTS